MIDTESERLIKDYSFNRPKPQQIIWDNVRPRFGDVNAYFGTVLDNLANLATIAGILIGSYGMPAEFVYTKIFPGLALAVMLGSLGLAIFAIQLSFRSDDSPKNIHTSIPIGLDAPTSIGIPLLVVGPAFLEALKSGMSEDDAAHEAWIVGCATVVLIGFLKFIMAFSSFFVGKLKRYPIVQRIIDEIYPHTVGMNGSLSGVSFALLGLLELTEIIKEPVAGLISLWILLLLMINRYNKNGDRLLVQLPGNFSAVLFATVCGTIIYYVMAFLKASVIPKPEGLFDDYYFSYPHPVNIFAKLISALTSHISIAIPYAILVNVGGVTVTNAAVEEGDKYSIPGILLVDSACTIIGGFFGGITQTTPYIGHSSFKREFEARSGYAIANGLTIGLGGVLGYLSFLSEALPKPAILPIFIFIAFDIVSYTYHAPTTKTWHAPAIMFAIFPSVAQLIQIIISQFYDGILLSSAQDPDLVQKLTGLSDSTVSTVAVIVILAHGFILTGLLWGSALAYVADNKMIHAGGILIFTSIITFFGIIHSVNPNGEVYLPWELSPSTNLPYQWTAAYFVLGVITLLAALHKPPVKEGHSDDNELDKDPSINYWADSAQ